jgi:hypothetical protein
MSTPFWERQPSETGRGFEAFRIYRDLGPTRSLSRAAGAFYTAEVPKPHQIRQLKEWSRRNMWVARAEAWDAEQQRMNELKRQEAAEDARARALRGSQLIQRISLQGLMQIGNRVGDAEEHPPLNLLRYWREGVEMEFIALGLPISVVQQEVVGNSSPPDHEAMRRRETYERAREALRGN